MSSPSTKSLLASKDCMGLIANNMPLKSFLNLQLVSKKFYDDVVPSVMNKLKKFPNVDPYMHLFIKDKIVYGMKVSQGTETHLVDFEEDEWLHDYQHEIKDDTHHKPEKLFTIDELPLNKDGKSEEVLIQNIVQIKRNMFIVFPLKDSVIVTRGIIVECPVNNAGER